MSLFITELACADPAVIDGATIGVLGGSIAAAVIGLVILAGAARGGAAPGPGRPARG